MGIPVRFASAIGFAFPERRPPVPTGSSHPETRAGQARYALDKIEAAIETLGGTLGDIVRTRIFVARIDDWKDVGAVHGERWGVSEVER